MMLRRRALGSIGLVLIALALGLGLVADPLVRRTLAEHRELASRLAAIQNHVIDPPPPPPKGVSEDAAITRLWIAVVIAGLVAPILCGIALRALFAPVDSLRKACQRVSEPGPVQPLDERRSDELGQLCAAFDRMRAKQEQSRSRSERHHERLETTVSQKTRQLEATVERLRSLDQMKDAFLTSASRELQSPVRAILAACDELDRPASVEPRAESLQRILSDCRQVDEMTRDILDFVRTSSDGFDYRLEPTTVEAVMRRALASVRGRMPRRDVALEVAGLGDCAVVWDANWIARVVESIVLRVVQRAPSGTTVFVEHRLHGPDVRIEIRSEGRAAERPAAAGGDDRADERGDERLGRALWTPVIDRHLGEWSEHQSDFGTSIIVVLPALAEHLGWQQAAG